MPGLIIQERREDGKFQRAAAELLQTGLLFNEAADFSQFLQN